MWFAFAFLLFFTIDILVETDFLVFGMIPFNALVTAVSLYTAIMLRTMRPLLHNRSQRIVYALWILFMFLMFAEHLIYIAYPLYDEWIIAETLDVFLRESNKIFFIGGLILLFLSGMFLRPLGRLCLWLLVSAAGVIVNFSAMLLLSPLPMMVYRYEGALGYIMLFGWLMSILTVIQFRYDPDSAGRYAKAIRGLK